MLIRLFRRMCCLSGNALLYANRRHRASHYLRPSERDYEDLPPRGALPRSLSADGLRVPTSAGFRTLFQLQIAYIEPLGELWQSSTPLRATVERGADSPEKSVFTRTLPELHWWLAFSAEAVPSRECTCTTVLGGPPGCPLIYRHAGSTPRGHLPAASES